jgi:hypothetical protein
MSCHRRLSNRYEEFTMSTPIKLIVVAAALLACASVAPTPASALPHAQVEVRFVKPENFTDATPSGSRGTDRERDATLAELRKHLEQLGARFLRSDDRLTIEVLDVDLAGRFEPWRARGHDVRYLLPITWPRLIVRTTLERAGERTEREEHIADLDYQRHALACRGSDRLCYEKRMLDDWFERRIGERGE